MAATDGCPKCNCKEYDEEGTIDPATKRPIKICKNCGTAYS